MAVNKVVYSGQTLVDLTADSVTADTLMEGVTAHDASGEEIVGTLPLSGLIYIINLNSGAADRTQKEIDAAYASGRPLLVRQNGKQYFLQSYDADSGYCFLNVCKPITSDDMVIELLYYHGGKWTSYTPEKATETDITTIVENAFK